MELNHIALALSMAQNVVPSDWNRLAEWSATPREIWGLLQRDAGLADLGAHLGHAVGPVPWGAFEDQLGRVERCRAEVVSRWDAAYPRRLRHVAVPPPILFVRGDVTCLQRSAVAIVGTRAPSAGGSAFAYRLARAVSARDVVVASGLARGIDTAAHQGALESARAGSTIAVLGTGVDVVYPAENADLMERVIASGCVVSEQGCGTPGASHVFPRRNRIISGLSEAVVVVEGGVKSGALITARWALDQGREVGAVPGFPGDFRSAGPNKLLREGAFVVEDADDVFTNVPGLRIPAATRAAPASSRDAGIDALDADARRVYDLVARDTDPDQVAHAAGLGVARVQEILARLEIEGWVVRSDGGRFTRSRTASLLG